MVNVTGIFMVGIVVSLGTIRILALRVPTGSVPTVANTVSVAGVTFVEAKCSARRERHSLEFPHPPLR